MGENHEPGTPPLQYASIVKRRFPNVTIDLVAMDGNEQTHLSFGLVADIIINHLKMGREEICRFNIFKEDKYNFVLKVRTQKDINVKERFSDRESFEFVDHRNNTKWRGSVRGIIAKESNRDTCKLRIINAPDEASNEEIINEIQKFTEVKSTIKEEVVLKEEEPRLAGLPTGILNVKIKKVSSIPRYLVIMKQKVRIHVVIPRDMCAKCYVRGHKAAICTQQVEKTQEEHGGEGNFDDDEDTEVFEDAEDVEKENVTNSTEWGQAIRPRQEKNSKFDTRSARALRSNSTSVSALKPKKTK